MVPLARRDFLRSALAATSAAAVGLRESGAAEEHRVTPGTLHLATFRFDVTPPRGHSLCGGWIKPVSDYDDPLEAVGYVLLGAGRPLVFCIVDWTGILNEAHRQWCTALAEAAGTTPDRVTVHCVHQHNAPFVCFESAQLLEGQPDLPKVFERDFFRQVLDRARAAVAESIPRARTVTHVARGEARVNEVAANRRVARDAAGRVTVMRGSACKDPALAALPEGLIDPMLRTVAFYDRGTKLVASHFYATHPMSYYGDGRVSSDFCGLARRRRQEDEPGCLHLYYTGCAGNVAAGKYNNGTPEARVQLTRRIYEGIVASDGTLRPEPVGRVEWRTQTVEPMLNPQIAVDALEELMTKRRDAVVLRMRPAFKLAFLRRCQRREAFTLGALHVNDVASVYLPSEPFVEFQLRAQEMARRPVAVAAYGDGGAWYIPTEAEYQSGGYEVEYAFVGSAMDAALDRALRRLLA
jgi:hypothetical protein